MGFEMAVYGSYMDYRVAMHHSHSLAEQGREKKKRVSIVIVGE